MTSKFAWNQRVRLFWGSEGFLGARYVSVFRALSLKRQILKGEVAIVFFFSI